MIGNLNPFLFKDYGTISPERDSKTQYPMPGAIRRKLNLTRIGQTIYKTVSNVRVNGEHGMMVLSVSGDGQEFQHFYLDKKVSIQPGNYFYLSPFVWETAEVDVSADIEPQKVGICSENNGFHVSNQIRVTELYTFFYQERERGFVFSGESHPMLELTYVDQGTLHSVSNGQDILLEQGDLLLLGANQWHMHYADMDVAPRYITVTFKMEGGDLTPILNHKIKPAQAGITLLQQMLSEHEQTDEFAADMIMAQLTQFMILLLRQQEKPIQKLKASNSLNSENEIIRRAQQYISSHIREKLSVPYVAKMADVSPSYLTALFHKNLQISPGEYIRRIKLQESKQMIRDGNLNFTEIAAALQYSTVHHFSRQFKEKFGITPTEYAKSVR